MATDLVDAADIVSVGPSNLTVAWPSSTVRALVTGAVTISVYVYGLVVAAGPAAISGLSRHARATDAAAGGLVDTTESVPVLLVYVAVPARIPSTMGAGCAGAGSTAKAGSDSTGSTTSKDAPSGPTSETVTVPELVVVVGHRTLAVMRVSDASTGTATRTHPVATAETITVPRGTSVTYASSVGTPRTAFDVEEAVEAAVETVEAVETGGVYVAVVAETVAMGWEMPWA
jgi:hypothetical protein